MQSAQTSFENIRKDFPILNRTVRDNKTLVYLDNASTTQKPIQVIDTINDFYKRFIKNSYHPQYQIMIDHILSDLNKGLNVVILLCGRQGTGKSYLSFLIAYMFNKYYFEKDPAFTIDDIYWDVEKFSKAMINLRNQFIVMEETSLSLSNLEWWSDTNKSLNKILDVFRISRVSMCLNLPFLFSLDKAVRLKGNYLLVTHKTSGNKVWASFHKKQMYEDTTKAYYDEIGWFDIPLIPNGEFDYKQYEEKKFGFNADKYKEIKEKLEGKEKKKVGLFGKPTGETVNLKDLGLKTIK